MAFPRINTRHLNFLQQILLQIHLPRWSWNGSSERHKDEGDQEMARVQKMHDMRESMRAASNQGRPHLSIRMHELQGMREAIPEHEDLSSLRSGKDTCKEATLNVPHSTKVSGRVIHTS